MINTPINNRDEFVLLGEDSGAGIDVRDAMTKVWDAAINGVGVGVIAIGVGVTKAVSVAGKITGAG